MATKTQMTGNKRAIITFITIWKNRETDSEQKAKRSREKKNAHLNPMHSDQQNTSGLEDFASVIAFPLQQKIQGERSRARHTERETETERDRKGFRRRRTRKKTSETHNESNLERQSEKESLVGNATKLTLPRQKYACEHENQHRSNFHTATHMYIFICIYIYI
jgi:hypothetical protein